MREEAHVADAEQVDKIRSFKSIILIAVLIAAGILVFVKFYSSYNEDVLYAERLNQMKEVTTQIFAGLEDVVKSEWSSTEMQCNFLIDEAPQSIDGLLDHMKRQTELSVMGEKEMSLIAVAADGSYYTESGHKGLLSEQRYLLSEPDRINFVTNSMFGESSYMVFLIHLNDPLTVSNENKSITITYYGIMQNMTELEPYFSCEAYGGNNGMYVTDEQGLKIFSDDPTAVIQGYNIYTVLENMNYLHGSTFSETKKQLDDTGSAYSNTVMNGEEYYYALHHMENAAWMLLFIVPSRYVATNTVGLVNTSMRIILIFAVFMVCTCTILIFWILTKQQKTALEYERRNREKLEKVNKELSVAVQKAECAEQVAKNASKAKSEFLSNMSHDIRTPMNAIVGITKLMEYDKDDVKKLDTYISKVQNSSQHLLSLINDVLDMSKIESGDISLNMEHVDLAEQIGQVENIIRPQVGERGQKFTVRVHDVEHEYLIGDPVRLRQIFINLLSNAVKYTPNGGAIKLDIEERPCDIVNHTEFCISVTDTGYGMDNEFLKHIFDPFTRAENSTTNKVQGTGLGMAITKNIVDMMGGTITVHSELNKGSRFDVVFNIEIDRNIEIETTIKSALVITDDKDFIRNTMAALRTSNIRLYTAENEMETYDILQENTVDVVLLGSKVYGRNLAEQVNRLRDKAKGALIIYCCDNEEQKQSDDTISASGADASITRPLFLSNLINTIDRIHEDKDEHVNEERPPLSGMHFLCAEDNALNAEILEAILDMNGASCTICQNGKEIVEAFAEVRPDEYDAILMDVQMPVMNGLEATKAIRQSENELGKTIPIIAMTANAFSSDVQNCINAGMNAHIAKPIDVDLLERTLQSLINNNPGGAEAYQT